MKNSEKNKVYRYQKFLKAQGLYSGPLDGIWGPKTQKGYEEFLKKQNSNKNEDASEKSDSSSIKSPTESKKLIPKTAKQENDSTQAKKPQPKPQVKPQVKTEPKESSAKEVGFLETISNLFSKNSKSSKNEPRLNNMDAINKYMPTTQGRYTVVDKQNNKVYLYDNGKLIGTDTAVLGSFKGDGYTITKDEKDWKNKARQTGAGIFSVGEVRDMYGLPGIALRDSNGKYVTEALHRNLGGGKRGDRGYDGSGGCVRTNLIPKKAGEGWYQKGDSVIVLPEMEGNYVYFDPRSKSFRTEFTNVPKTVQHDGFNQVELLYNHANAPQYSWYDPRSWF